MHESERQYRGGPMLSLLPLVLWPPRWVPRRPRVRRTPCSNRRPSRAHHRQAVQRLLRTGVMRSRTFAALLASPQRSDVIVYIEPTQTLPSALDGRLLLMPTAHGLRYLRIQVVAAMSPAKSSRSSGTSCVTPSKWRRAGRAERASAGEALPSDRTSKRRQPARHDEAQNRRRRRVRQARRATRLRMR